MDKNQKPAEFRSEQIVYVDSFVAFIDILGFSEIVLDGDIDKVSKYYSEISLCIENLKYVLNHVGVAHAQIMSDSVVVGVTPKQNDQKSQVECLKHLCICLSYIQYTLGFDGIWMRGGLSYGKISFHDSRFVVGPALVTAVQLEKIAKYPRIVIEPKILNALNLSGSEFIAAMKASRPKTTTPTPYVRSSNEVLPGELPDLFFVDFGSLMPSLDAKDVKGAKLLAHNINKGLYDSPKYLEKYQWLHKYFLSLPLSEEAAKYFVEL